MATRLDLDLDLDLDVFIGPFDLLLSIVLREEISLLEVELGEIVALYVTRLEEQGELELEVATEFLVLVAALLELKSRLMLPGAEDDLSEMEPAEAVEELVARMLEYRRYRDAGRELKDHFESQRGFLYRSAPLPPELRRVEVETAEKVYEPEQLAAALGDLLEPPPRPDLSHMRATVSLRRRLSAVRSVLMSRPVFDFDDEFGSEDRMTQAVTIFALLDLYKKGEADWEQSESCGPITVRRSQAGQAGLAQTA
ncbi:MAG: Segregation/condensation protein [Actinomycetota bacterium]|nr:Segregation/condensation protein [Actinomycetota bacterium]